MLSEISGNKADSTIMRSREVCGLGFCLFLYFHGHWNFLVLLVLAVHNIMRAIQTLAFKFLKGQKYSSDFKGKLLFRHKSLFCCTYIHHQNNLDAFSNLQIIWKFLVSLKKALLCSEQLLKKIKEIIIQQNAVEVKTVMRWNTLYAKEVVDGVGYHPYNCY